MLILFRETVVEAKSYWRYNIHILYYGQAQSTLNGGFNLIGIVTEVHTIVTKLIDIVNHITLE